jgi:hypothetical protein
MSSVMDGYDPNETAIGKEKGLFSVAPPSKSLCLKGERCSSGRLSKECIISFPQCFHEWRDCEISGLGRVTKL